MSRGLGDVYKRQVLQIVNIVLDGAIYYFFFKALDRDKVKEEKTFAAKEAAGKTVEA